MRPFDMAKDQAIRVGIRLSERAVETLKDAHRYYIYSGCVDGAMTRAALRDMGCTEGEVDGLEAAVRAGRWTP